MSAQPDRHLNPVPDEVPLIVVDPSTGEQRGPLGDFTQALQDEIDGLNRDISGWRTRYANLRRDAEAEAKEHPVWSTALRVFDHWRRVCKHPRAEWNLERFELIRPHLERLSQPKKGRLKDPVERLKHAEEICMLAVEGINLDCYVSDRKNGTKKRHDGWHLIFDGNKFEDRVNSAPLDRIREVMGPTAGQQSLDQPQADD